MEFNSRKILIVSYYWPPATGPGAKRVYELVEFLKLNDFHPVIITSTHKKNHSTNTQNSIFYIYDPIPESTSTGVSFYASRSILQKLKAFIRGNLFIPDAKLFWLRNVKKALRSILKEHEIECCIVSGPPQSCHLVGHHVKKKYQIPTVHDMRDPWLEAFFLKDFYRTPIANLIDKMIERRALLSASLITIVSPTLKVLIDKKLNNRVPVEVVYNGYMSKISQEKTTSKFKEIIYTGTLTDSEIPTRFLLTLPNLELILKIYGTVHPDIHRFIDSHNLNDYIIINQPVPHQEILRIQNEAEIFLLLITNTPNNEGILSAKLFEYLAGNRPIIAFGPTNGDCSDILLKSGMGKMFSYDESDLIDKIQIFLSQSHQINKHYVEQFHRHHQYKNLVNYLDSI